jgi:hypothetical protein
VKGRVIGCYSHWSISTGMVLDNIQSSFFIQVADVPRLHGYLKLWIVHEPICTLFSYTYTSVIKCNL